MDNGWVSFLVPGSGRLRSGTALQLGRPYVPEVAVFHLRTPKPSAEPQTSTGEHDGKTGFQKGACRALQPQEQGLGSSRCARHEFPEHDLAFNGRHHEIYLSDPRKTVPEKLKTILRQPVRHL